MILSTGGNLVLREDSRANKVRILFDDKLVISFTEYKQAAEYVKRTYNLTDPQLIDLYRDYRDEAGF